MHATGLVQVTDRYEGAVPVCAIKGELDASNVERVLSRIIGSVADDTIGLVLDLGALTYLDSAGVRIIFDIARRLRTRGQTLRIAVPPSGVVRRVLVLTAVGDVIPLDDDVATAVRRLHKPI